MTREDAVSNLKSFKVEFSGEGNIVTYQTPKANTQIYEGEIVKLLLSDWQILKIDIKWISAIK